MVKEFYILYGSQTGNAESIAKELHARLVDMGLPATCGTCNEAKGVDLKEMAAAVIIGGLYIYVCIIDF
jgi:sulfite reductase alpha subunit-like flavoprotein